VTDTVIKIGGSLLKGNNLTALCKSLGDIGKKHRILIIPGGGVFADAVRVLSKKYKIDPDTAHWMAILAMNQYGHLLSSLIPESVPVENIDEAKKYLNKLVPVVLLPYHLIKTLDPLPHSWDVTSDSIAAWITGYIGAERLLLTKSIDIQDERGQAGDYRTTVDMERLKNTDIVDPMFYKTIKGIKANVWIINGNYLEQLTDFFRLFPL
jgi:5-(aminomethyl)-3-furanmethanol phosphate kinase